MSQIPPEPSPIIFGIIAHRSIAAGGAGGAKLATAGILTGIAGTVLSFASLLFAFGAFGNRAYFWI